MDEHRRRLEVATPQGTHEGCNVDWLELTARCRARMASRCGARSPTACDRTSRPASARPGGRLPTEAELSRRFAVNRHTVRARAGGIVARAGLVRIEQGRGTFVAEDVLEYTVEPRTRFTEWIRKHNMEPSGKTLQLREIAADSHIANGLGLRTGARVILLERLGLADDRPVSLRGTTSPPLACPACWTPCAPTRVSRTPCAAWASTTTCAR